MRGLAAMMVVCFHVTTRFGDLYGHPSPLAVSLPYGIYGVQLFFVISGMLIAMTLQRSRSVGDFIVNRTIRLYPTYWLAIPITFIVTSLAGLPGRTATLSQVGWNLTMAQGFLGIPDVDGVYWSLKVELAFYVVMAAIFAMGWLRRLDRVALLWSIALWAEYFTHGFSRVWDPLGHMVTLYGYAELFLLGIGVYLFRERQRSVETWVAVAAAVGLYVWRAPSFEQQVVMSALVLVAVLVVKNKLTLLEARPLVFLGAISYPLYLIHQNIGFVILRALYARGVAPVAAISLTIAAGLLLATAIHYAVEMPAQRRFKNAYRNWRALPSLASNDALTPRAA